MRRRWIADTFSPATGHPTTAALTGDQAHHLAHVLRATPGQVFDVVANGFLHRAEITAVSDKEVRFLLHEEIEAASALPLHLLLAVFKFDHFEWAIEKATELGVARITPIVARRTEKHLAQAAAKRVERWRRIALEAAKQSRRTDIPEIADPATLKLALEAESSPVRILLSETEQGTTLSAALTAALLSLPDQTFPLLLSSRSEAEGSAFLAPANEDRVPHPSQPHREGWNEDLKLALAIGPEGGWTTEEMSLFTHHHWQHVTLGPRILRAETAAIAAIAIVSSHLT
jgi:16S rRNA (uracil1498-N3)-methyltransferase